jgi:ParB-like chromosome segregation protein Spo0J
MGIVLELEIKEIHIPWELLPRVITGVVEDKVKEYAEMIESGVEFDPILVWDRKDKYWVIDGVHRIEAHKRVGKSTIKAKLVSCKDETDYRIKAIRENLKHGLSLKKEERILSAQELYYHHGVSVKELCEIFGVSERTVYYWIGDVIKQRKEDLKEQALQLRAQGFTQEAVAKMLGVDQTTISVWEKEKNKENQKEYKEEFKKNSTIEENSQTNMDYEFLQNLQKFVEVDQSQNLEEDSIDIEEAEVAFETEEDKTIQEVKQEKREGGKIEDWPFPVNPKTLLPEWIDRFRNDKEFRVRYMVEYDVLSYMHGLPIKYKDWIVEHEKEDYEALWKKCWLKYYKHKYEDSAKFPPIPPVPKSEKELARERENQINVWVESEEFKSLIKEIFNKIVEIARYKGKDYAQKVIDELERRWEEWLYQNWELVKKR